MLYQKLLNEGWKIELHHRRAMDGDKILLKSGETHAVLTSPEGTIVTGSAVCSNKDNFRKAVGREIAIGRAYKAYKTLEV